MSAMLQTPLHPPPRPPMGPQPPPAPARTLPSHQRLSVSAASFPSGPRTPIPLPPSLSPSFRSAGPILSPKGCSKISKRAQPPWQRCYHSNP
jgi:hypothetical protein